MNYRTMLRGALALSLGLIVGAASAETTSRSDIQKYGATFEATENTTAGELNDFDYGLGTNITAFTKEVAGETFGWFGAAEDESKIVAGNGGQALQLNTDAGTLTNKLSSSIATDVNAGIAGAGAYIETEAKFVASDTLDAGIVGGTDDTKFAIYAYADENASPCTTNLVVYHGMMDGNGVITYTNEVFNTLINCDVYTKLRVEMKQVMNPSTFESVNVFSVKVGNNAPLTSNLAFTDGIWFLTVADPLDDDAAELASVNFKGTGEVDNLSVGVIQETTTYAIDWSASQNVIASNLTDTVQLAAGDTNFVDAVQLAFYPTEGNVITNVLVNGVESRWNDNCFEYTVSSSTGDEIVTVLAGIQAAPPATVISVATVGNATVTDNQDGTYTISVPLGNGLSSVFVNGAAVDPSLLTEGAGGTYTLDLSGASGTVNVVVATKKVRTPIGHKWWENPTIVGTTAHGLNTANYGMWHMNGDGDYVAGTGWAPTGNNTMKVFAIDDLVAGSASAVAANQAPNTYSSWGAAVSMALNVALVGSYTVDAPAVAYSLNAASGTIGTDAFLIENDEGIAFNDMEFTADGQYLYAAAYAPDAARNYIYKFRVLNGLKSSGVNLVLDTKYNMGARVRSMTIGEFSGGDVIYALLNNNTVKYIDTAAALPAATDLIANYTAAGYNGDIMVTAENTATPHIAIFGSDNTGSASTSQKSLDVFTLNATGTAVVGEPLLSLDKDGCAAIGLSLTGNYGFSGFITEDEETFIFSWGTQNVYAIQYVEPQYTATYTGSENVIVTNTYDGSSYEWGEGEAVVPTQIACLSGTVLSFYPTEGNVITNVTIGGVEQTGFDPACYSITVISDTNIVVLAGVEAVTPTTYTVDWTGSENVDVTVDGDFWDGGTAGNFTNNTVVTFTPTSGMMITNVAGEAVGPISEFSLTVTEATNIVVLAGVAQPVGRIKPEWAADADTTKFWNWVDNNNVSDYASVDYTTEYLLNVATGEDPAPEIKITSITVGATATTIEVRGTVGRGLVDFADLNGVLNVAVGSSVTSLTPKAIPAANLDTSVEGVATITIPNADGCFFRARVDFEAPQTSLTAVSE